MLHEENDNLQEELEQFRAEKEKIRSLVGQIGGKASAKRDRVVNGVFMALLAVLFAADLLRHFHVIDLPFPTLFSLEIGILLVSVKIIWMIHKQARVEHFQFWILNSIEFRLNNLSKRFRTIEERLQCFDMPEQNLQRKAGDDVLVAPASEPPAGADSAR
ncbi:MAG: hypothetical protein GF331_03990 [Chitinivibrionales bacterium]|nr:hypothetical protein [Chitinivibrionales bacterium]